MLFELKEIKILGRGLDTSLSVRFDDADGYGGLAAQYEAKPRYTIHAVLPYTPEFGQLQIGQLFHLEREGGPLNRYFEPPTPTIHAPYCEVDKDHEGPCTRRKK